MDKEEIKQKGDELLEILERDLIKHIQAMLKSKLPGILGIWLGSVTSYFFFGNTPAPIWLAGGVFLTLGIFLTPLLTKEGEG